MTRANAYVMRYRLNLFSNFTYFLDDPENGDQFEQADRRWVGGGRLSHRRRHTFARSAEMSFGVELRRDDIGEVGLYRTARGSGCGRSARTKCGNVHRAFVHHEMQWTPRVRTNVGLRADRYWFAVRAGNAGNAGVTGDGLFSPKASAMFGPWRRTELYVSAGTGFHSNDARGTTITVDPSAVTAQSG